MGNSRFISARLDWDDGDKYELMGRAAWGSQGGSDGDLGNAWAQVWMDHDGDDGNFSPHHMVA